MGALVVYGNSESNFKSFCVTEEFVEAIILKLGSIITFNILSTNSTSSAN